MATKELSNRVYGGDAPEIRFGGLCKADPLAAIASRESPREIVAHDCKDLNGGLPINGGWGYTREDACVIEKDDSLNVPDLPFNGVGVEYVFVEKRIYEEMVIWRPDGQKFAGIEWKLLRQELSHVGARSYDKLVFEITAFHDPDWDELKAEYLGPKGVSSSLFDADAHERKRNERRVRFTREFWFDITSFFGQG